MQLAMAVFRCNMDEATGITPFKSMPGIDAFDFDAEIGWKTMLDEQNEGESLPDRLRSNHDELIAKEYKLWD
jgi:hypothetical protein